VLANIPGAAVFQRRWIAVPNSGALDSSLGSKRDPIALPLAASRLGPATAVLPDQNQVAAA
jgi:hypothetical protein